MSTIVREKNESTEAELRTLVMEIDELPSLPETLIEILKVLDDPNSGPADLGQVIRLDAPLMARILRLANSPYYSRRGDITDINRCVSVLGYRTVRQVAICVSVATSVISALAKSPGKLDYKEIWKHSVVTAAIAKHLAVLAKYPDPEEVFTAGLLHDMGKFVLELHAPQKYWEVINHRLESGRTLCEVENEFFGFDHCILGRAFGQAWRFPEILCRCFAEHHVSVEGGKAQTRNDHAVALVSLADYLANTMEPNQVDLGFDPVHADPQALHQVAGLTMEEVQANLAQISESVALASGYMDLT